MEMNILNLGAGVQSTTVLLMSCKGLLPKLDCAIFADTGWEPDEVYEHLHWLSAHSIRHGIAVHRVQKGNLRKYELLDNGRTLIPGFVGRQSKGGGIKLRECTQEYKIEPILKYIKREILGLKPRQRVSKGIMVNQWFGISSDESRRIRSSPDHWRNYVYPLCGIPKPMLPKTYSRLDCQDWLRENWPLPVPRSACLGCPFHSNSEWRRIKENPKYWKDVTEFDRAIRHSGGMRGEVYLHRSLKPLDEVDFSMAEDHGQGNLFKNECFGMCGV